MPFNQFFMNPVLAAPKYHQLGPNVDTLNGHAWFDLTNGPQVIGVPDTQGRYYSIHLQDMYMNSFTYIGRRTYGTKAGAFALTPPGFKGRLPKGVTEIKAPTTRVFALVRTFVRDSEDVENARAVNIAMTTGPLSAFPNGRQKALWRPDRTTFFPSITFLKPDPTFFDELDQLVRTYPPLPWDAPNLARFAPLGIGGPRPVKRDAALQAELAAAVPAGYAQIKRSLHLTWRNGWARRENVVPFIRDPLQRAANNLWGQATHLSVEAVYWGTHQGGMGEWLTGENRYRIRFAPGQMPPADAFWSITLYDEDYILFDNPLNRYAVLDRTKGLKFDPDGSLVIQVQADPPAEGTANWLPAPRGKFQLNGRAYQPRQAILDGSYCLPQIEVLRT